MVGQGHGGLKCLKMADLFHQYACNQK